MTDEEFWAIIAASRTPLLKEDDGENTDRHEAELTRLLSVLPAPRVAEFFQQFQVFNVQAYRRDLWGAAYLIRGGCSDDGFMDFRNGLIFSGREFYEAALADADSLADVVPLGDESLFFETIGYVVGRVYWEKTREDLSAPIVHEPEDPVGEDWYDEDEEIINQNLSRLLPRLYAVFGEE